jgi:hypothetical protein
MPDAPISNRELVDRLLIDDLLTRYTVAIDTKDWKLLDRVFTPDAEIDYTRSGGVKGRYPEVRAWLERALSHFCMTQHLIANSVVRLDGDRATARTMFYNPMGAAKQEGGLHLFFIGGYYNDELARTRDGWRIAQRVEEQSWMEGTLPPGFVIPS